MGQELEWSNIVAALKVLIVEDDRVSQKLIEHFLRPFGECTVASDGAEGFSFFKDALEKNEPFDLVCLDIMLPEMSGQEVLDSIRQYEKERGVEEEKAVKIIMTTAHRDVENSLHAFSHGCQAYVTKPIEKNLLIAEIKKLGIYPLPE